MSFNSRKWLIIQEASRHPENRYFRECYALKHALEQHGQLVDIWGFGHDNFTTEPKFDSYDVIFTIENYSFAWIPDLSVFRGPLKLQWIIDLHCNESMHFSKVSAWSDIILHSTRELIPRFQSKFCKSKENIWFPNGVDDRFFTPQESKKIIPLGFVGTVLRQRQGFIDGLKHDLGLKQYFIRGQGMIDKIRLMNVHFNKNVGCDLNYRCFETIGLGTPLLTNDNEMMRDLGFADMKNCIVYRDYDECVEKYKSLQDNDLQQISAGAIELARENTYVKRIENCLIPTMTKYLDG
jgi:hypothetical protein